MGSSDTKRFAPIIFGLWGLMAALTGCGGAPANSADPLEEVSTSTDARVETLVLVPDVFEDLIEISGAVESVDDALLSAQTAGTVEMLIPLGRSVSKGATVAQLDQGLVAAALEQAEASVDNAAASLMMAEDNFNRLEPLYQDSIISALEFQETRTRLQQARATMRQAQAIRSQAQEQLANTMITAPFAGTIEEHRVTVGEQVAPGNPVVRVINTRRVKIAVGVPERYAGDIEVGTEVVLDFHALDDMERRGQVTFAANSINPRNRTFSIEAEVSNADGRLKPEMIADVLISRQQLEGVLIIPRAAVVKDEDGDSVFIVDNSGGNPVARRKNIALGAAYAERVVVQSGLEAGDEVIILGQNIVTDGVSVEVAAQYQHLDPEGIPVSEGSTMGL